MLSPSPPDPSRTPSLVAMQVATCLGLGRLKPGPGTIASAAACLVAWPLLDAAWLVLLLALAASVAGTWSISRLREAGIGGDPSFVVIDELAGQWLAIGIAGLASAGSVLVLVGCFLGFRLLDIAKPGPIGWLDRRLEPWSVVADDLAAGGITGVAVVLGLAL